MKLLFWWPARGKYCVLQYKGGRQLATCWTAAGLHRLNKAYVFLLKAHLETKNFCLKSFLIQALVASRAMVKKKKEKVKEEKADTSTEKGVEIILCDTSTRLNSVILVVWLHYQVKLTQRWTPLVTKGRYVHFLINNFLNKFHSSIQGPKFQKK